PLKHIVVFSSRIKEYGRRVLGTRGRGRIPRPRAGFVRNVAVLAGGTALGQLLTIAASPVLTRLYDPADFGVLGVYAALLTTITTVASLRYELAIPVSDDEEEAASLLVLCLVAVIGT